MAPNHISRQNMAKHVSTKTRAKTRASKSRGMKRPGKALEQVIRAVNLVPRDADLPEKLIVTITDPENITQQTEKTIKESLPSELAEFLITILHTELADLSDMDRSFSISATYQNILAYHDALHRVVQLVRDKEITYLRECKSCGGIFFAGRDTQWYCPKGACLAASKEARQKKWLAEYERKHGHPYRPKKRESRRLVKVRRLLKTWEQDQGTFTPTDENLRIIAGDADITLKQCREFYSLITNQKEGTK